MAALTLMPHDGVKSLRDRRWCFDLNMVSAPLDDGGLRWCLQALSSYQGDVLTVATIDTKWTK